jgi:predicted nucleotidyltransferase
VPGCEVPTFLKGSRNGSSTSKPDKIILFGSYARGGYRPDSDLNAIIKDQVESIHAETTTVPCVG